jgi:hypothetical protein
LLGGLILISLKLEQGEKADLKEIFQHFDQFFPTLLIILLTGVAWYLLSIINAIPLIGRVATLVTIPALSLISALALAFAVEKNLNPLEAFRQSIGTFLTNPLQYWIYSLCISLLAGLGALFFFLPVVLTAPLGVVGVTLAYRELSEKTPVSLDLGKKEIRLGLSTVAILLILGLIFHFAFGFRSSFSGLPRPNRLSQGLNERITGKILSSLSGEKVKIGKDGTSITVGGVTFGEQLPKDYPSDLPVYSKAKVVSYLGGPKGEGSTATFSTEADIEEIADFYQRELKKKGWSTEFSSFGELVIITFKKDDDARSGSVTITATEEETTFLLTHMEE